MYVILVHSSHYSVGSDRQFLLKVKLSSLRDAGKLFFFKIRKVPFPLIFAGMFFWREVEPWTPPLLLSSATVVEMFLSQDLSTTKLDPTRDVPNTKPSQVSTAPSPWASEEVSYSPTLTPSQALLRRSMLERQRPGLPMRGCSSELHFFCVCLFYDSKTHVFVLVCVCLSHNG